MVSSKKQRCFWMFKARLDRKRHDKPLVTENFGRISKANVPFLRPLIEQFCVRVNLRFGKNDGSAEINGSIGFPAAGSIQAIRTKLMSNSTVPRKHCLAAKYPGS